MIKVAVSKEEIESVLDIRYEVQFKDLGVPKEDCTKNDPEGEPISLLCIQNNKPIASATAFLNESNAVLEHLGVLPNYQKKGIGKEMVKEMEKELKKKNVKKIVILARTYLKKFYNELGYKSVGEIKEFPEFVKKGIYHQDMEKVLG